MNYAIVRKSKVLQECTYEDLDLALKSEAGAEPLHVFSRVEPSDPWEYDYTVRQRIKAPRIAKTIV